MKRKEMSVLESDDLFAYTYTERMQMCMILLSYSHTRILSACKCA